MFSRKLLILYFILLAIAICMMLALVYFKPVPMPVRDYDEIRAEGVLRIVTEYDRTGYHLTDEGIEGFQYALCSEIARLSGIETLMFLEMNLETSFYGLETNQYDIVARNIPITSELKERYRFLDPIVLNRLVLVQRTAAANNGVEPLRDQLVLAHKTLYVPKDSPARLRIRHLCREIGDTIYTIEDPLYSSEQLCIMVARGDIEFAVCDMQTARLAQQQLPDIDIATDIGFTQLQSWAVRKNAITLADSLNVWLKQLRDSGKLDEIREKFYHAQ